MIRGGRLGDKRSRWAYKGEEALLRGLWGRNRDFRGFPLTFRADGVDEKLDSGGGMGRGGTEDMIALTASLLGDSLRKVRAIALAEGRLLGFLSQADVVRTHTLSDMEGFVGGEGRRSSTTPRQIWY